MRDQSEMRSFSRQYKHYRMTISHQASRVHVKTFNSESSEVKQEKFQYSSLSQRIRQEHETVDDLFDYLSNNSSIDFQIWPNFVGYRDGKFANSDWLYFPFTENAYITTKAIENDRDMDQTPIHQSESSSGLKSNWAEEKRRLISQNANLKKQIARLSKRQRERKLQQKKNKPKQKESITHHKMSFFTRDESNLSENLQFCMEEFDFYSEVPRPVDIKLSVNKKCAGFQHYKMADNRITKTSQTPAILSFKQTVNRNESKRFAFKIQTELINNWIIIGLLRKQLINRQFCYFIKNSIAYSGSMGIIFVDHEALDIGVVPSRGDLLQIVVHNRLHVIQWIMNRQLICSHKIPESMLEHKLFPFIMLAHSKDSVSINIPVQ